MWPSAPLPEVRTRQAKALFLNTGSNCSKGMGIAAFKARAAQEEIKTRNAEKSERELKNPGLKESATHAEQAAAELVLPAIEEKWQVTQQQIETAKVRIKKLVAEREEIIDEPLIREEVSVERIPVNRFVKQATPPRYEGETLVISLFEEVPVVEKRLLLKEELRVTKRRIVVPHRQSVTLRGERLKVERSTPDTPADDQYYSPE
jgi:uncharacterized protein (TIGR02271 family)